MGKEGEEEEDKDEKEECVHAGVWGWGERKTDSKRENKNKREYSWTNRYYCASITGSSESESFSISLKKMMSTNMLSDSP